jgi:hypothetical protein
MYLSYTLLKAPWGTRQLIIAYLKGGYMTNTSPRITTQGKWSIGFAIVAMVCFIVFFIEIHLLGFKGGDTWTWDWPSMPILFAGVSFISAFVTGIISILKYKEKSTLVIISAIIGGLVMVFLLGEFLVPH